MPLHEALALGALQGLTEFLPVSSSGHLVIIPAFLGWSEPGLPFVVAVHLGTLLAVVAYYWKDWLRLVAAATGWIGKLGRQPASPGARTMGLLFLATIPAAAVGITLAQPVETLFNKPAFAAGALLVTGLLLLAADARRAEGKAEGKGEAATTWREALAVGVAQAVAVVPGISRSGATIATGLFAGLEREWAARFAFLLSVPVILGAGLKEIPDALKNGLTLAGVEALFIGAAAACLSGLVAIYVVIRAVRGRRLRWFAAYCFGLGFVTLVCHRAGLIA
jgi:undecaprenyl-diphosphatase